jgi:hypothetical protein
MITDPVTLAELQSLWNGVRSFQQRIRNNTVFAFGGGGGIGATNLGRLAHNLPFLNGCAVLNDALLALRDQGVFTCRSFFLGALHKESKSVIPRVDWALIHEVIDKRNDLAHKSIVVPIDDCLRYVDAIECELEAWGIL